MALIVFAGLALVGLGAGPAGAATDRSDVMVSTRTDASLLPQKSSAPADPARVAGDAAVAAHAPGAGIICETGSPLGIHTTANGGIEVEFRLACRWSDDGSLATEVLLNTMYCGIILNGSRVVKSTVQPNPGPTGSCYIALQPHEVGAGVYRGVVAVTEYLQGGGIARGGPYYTVSTVTIV
ncbi:MAG TPA: hypothetical protein VGX25_10020 [Actinophytocola sp.]|uniref:hypothetical protein n=1 Tax=Actinophytocola sp. TaxID=1872138 RepID=UPI002DDCE7F6|nr:hypothetical protein [Actinophytocola sp.]HEV2779725.1 hypothetical protein [Actinophytocola sp.]